MPFKCIIGYHPLMKGGNVIIEKMSFTYIHTCTHAYQKDDL